MKKNVRLMFFAFANAVLLTANVNAANGLFNTTLGDGSLPSTPLLVEDAYDLAAINSSVNLGKNFKLSSDIDLTAWIQSQSSISGWNPIGNTTTPFTGTFDGDGHVITGLWINSATVSGVGLFGVVSGTVTIQNLGVKTATDKTIKGGNTGGIVGLTTGGSTTSLTVSQCFFYGTVENASTTNPRAGGIVGYSTTNITISNCYAVGTISNSGDGSGGILGAFWAGNSVALVENCYAVNTVASAIGSAGGIVGGAGAAAADISTSQMTIRNCVAANATVNGSALGTKRVLGYTNRLKAGFPVYQNNEAFTSLLVNNAVATGGTTTNNNGLDKSSVELKTPSTYDTWNFTDVWTMGNVNYPLPVLKNLSITDQPSIVPSHLADTPTAILNQLSEKTLNYFTQSGELKISQKSAEELVTIYNLTGQKLLTSKESTISISNFPKGIYLVKCSGKSLKIIKN